MPSPKLKVLFLCTGNSCRSQMAEGWTHKLKSDCIEPYSAGIEIHGLNSNAVRVMAEAGINISGQRSKHLDELRDVEFDYVVTVCGQAHEHCPIFPSKAKIVHVAFDDPHGLQPMVERTKNASLPTAVSETRSSSSSKPSLDRSLTDLEAEGGRGKSCPSNPCC